MTARALMILVAVLLAGCASVDTSARGASAPTAEAARPASPGVVPAASPSARPTPIDGDPATIVRRSIPAERPRLLPTWVPAGMAPATTVDGGGYVVVYADDLHTKEINFTDRFGVNPPPQTSPSAVSVTRRFRGVGATYVIYDGSAPTSQRYLMWDEPGSWPTGEYGMRTNQFFLEAGGLTEGEFFQVADSLRALT